MNKIQCIPQVFTNLLFDSKPQQFSKEFFFSTNGADMTGYHVQKDKLRPLPHSIIKNQSKMNHRLKYKS